MTDPFATVRAGLWATIGPDGDAGRKQAGEALTAIEQEVARLKRIGDNAHAQITFMLNGFKRALQQTGDWTPADAVMAIEQCADMLNARDHLKADLSRVEQERDAYWEAYADELMKVIDQLKTERDRLQAETTRLRGALKKLRNEASGFLGLDSREVHGNTNIAVLQLRIDEASAVLGDHVPEA